MANAELMMNAQNGIMKIQCQIVSHSSLKIKPNVFLIMLNAIGDI